MSRCVGTGVLARSRSVRAGATLISAVLSMTIITMCLVMMLQAYMQGSRCVAMQARKAQATAVCQDHIERVRADGFHSLPAQGEYPFRLADEPEPLGRLTVVVGPEPDSRLVTARIAWPSEDRMARGSVELATILTAKGISP